MAKPGKWPVDADVTVTVHLSEIPHEEMIDYLVQTGKLPDPDETPVSIHLSGSIQDAELAEVIVEAYQKHGHKLAERIRNL